MIKKKLLLWILLVPLFLFVLFAFSGCEALIAALTSVSGTVVDARDEALSGVPSVTVTLTAKDGTLKGSAVTDSKGYFNISNVDPGEYTLQASASGWFFVPKDVFVGGMAQDLGKVLGIKLDSDTKLADSALSFVLIWNSQYMDVDGHLTFAKGDGLGYASNPISGIGPFTKPNEDYSSGVAGFGPDSSSFREHIQPTFYESSTNTVSSVMGTGFPDASVVTLDRDDMDGSGPEVITVRSIPYWYTSPGTATTPDGVDTGNYLPKTDPDGTSVTYYWVGVMEYYIDGWNETQSGASRPNTGNLLSYTDGNGADAVVFVIQGSNLIGKFVVPTFTNIRTADMVRVNLFITNTNYTYFQIVPNIRAIDYNDIKAIGDTQVTGFFGPKRSK